MPGYGSFVGYYPTTGAVFALLGNSNGNTTGVATGQMWSALAPVLDPIVIVPPTASCAPPPPADVVVTPVVVAVVATPAFTG